VEGAEKLFRLRREVLSGRKGLRYAGNFETTKG
jgi:hypothetical protein